MNPFRRDSPAPQTRADSERHDEMSFRIAQETDRFIFQMVVMIVGDDEEVKLGQLLPGKR